jgi:O-antigen/teichoic acid export membrane protein
VGVGAAGGVLGTGLEALGLLYAAAAAAVLVAAAARTRSLMPRAGRTVPDEDRADFDRSARAFLVLGLTGLAQTSGVVLLLGLVLETEALGAFRAALQFAALVSIPPIALGAVFPPRYAAHHHAGDHTGLERAAAIGTLLSIATAGPIAAGVLLFPEALLGLLGEEFRGAAGLLRILAAGHFANAALNLVGYVLTGCGHEGAARNIRLTTTIAGLLALLPASHWFGAPGAAWVVAGMLAVQNLLFVYATWRTAGVWSLPGPNLLARLGVRGGATLR